LKASGTLAALTENTFEEGDPKYTSTNGVVRCIINSNAEVHPDSVAWRIFRRCSLLVKWFTCAKGSDISDTWE